jgi:serine/threonine protein kinase
MEFYDKSHLFEEKKNNNEDIGKSYGDFEILERIKKEEENPLKITKVRSKKNHKIYCMKKLQKRGYVQSIDDLKKDLKNIKNPHIIKYYTCFDDVDHKYIYIIMEYIDTDIKNFIEGYKLTHTEIPEEKIWFILLQCLSALDYLHSKNLKECEVKLANILMPNENSIKIGVIKNNLSNNNYDKLDDIKLLSKYLYAMMFPNKIEHGKSINNFYFEKINNNYSKKLREVIYDMHENPKEAKKLFEYIENHYCFELYKLKNKKIFPSIKAVFKLLKEYVSYGNNKNEEDSYMIKLYKDINEAPEESNEYICLIEKFRRYIALEYPSLNNEIELKKDLNPNAVLEFILNKFEIEDESTIKKLYKEIQITKECQTCKSKYVSIKERKAIDVNLVKQKKDEKLDSLIKDLKSNNIKIEEDRFYCDGCLTYQKYEEDLNKDLIIFN